MPTSLRFYREILGFKVVMQSQPGEHFDWALLTAGGASFMLNTAYEAEDRPAAPEPGWREAHRDVT